MEFDRLEQAWRSEANSPDAQAQAYLMEQLMQMLKTRRRGEMLLALIPTAAMTFFTGVAGQAVLDGRIDLAREWGGLAMLGVCWAVIATVLIASVLAKRPPHDGSPMRQTLEALLAANHRARVGFRIFLISMPVFIVPTLIGVFQLEAVGKATERNITQMLLMFGVALVASVGWNALRFFRVLKPEQRRLEALLAEYEG
ncbi:hypothetical protein [Caulobacter soli]|uniref:hypothetical protein n=1 Tax=Caulobacter soli TaxID=2708539 RepID=UPI0013ED06A2|nr:hypothetical protein [Caulobacter soli]